MITTDESGNLPDRSALMRMATGYLARYAASSDRLRQVLARRIRRWQAARDLETAEAEAIRAAIDEVVARLQDLGLLDDAALAASRTRTLARKGLPEYRIALKLRSQGLEAPDRTDADPPLDEATQALRFAERKRLGPFRLGERTAHRDKDLRRLLRAGFPFGIAAATVDGERDEAHDGTP